MKTQLSSAILLGFSVVFFPFSANSQGSMANPSQVIIVRPAPEIRRQSEIRRMENTRQAAEKSKMKSDAAAAKAVQKNWDAETKIYRKKLAAQSKSRKK
jgi:hypothetical protein